MSPRIDPILPIVWRSPAELQFGATPRVVLRDPGAFETGLISALRHGASASTLETIGTALGGTAETVHALLELLAPAFEPATDAAASVRSPRCVALDAPREISDRLAEHLARLGYEPVPAAEAEVEHTALAVVAATWVVSPGRHLPWLRADVPHLAIVFDDEGTRVGPLVEPGDGPCLRCLELARRDDDPAWPVIAAQLAGRPAASCTPRAVHDAAALVASLVDDRLAGARTPLRGASIRLGRPGETVPTTPHRRHPECGCRVPAGTATAPVRLDSRRPDAASSTRGAAVPA
ncbi:bacteriocin biosynthesis cyclodehydratase domain-containing protein [Agromyces cerinus]|nr:bacteriocin biosynthesis cyclodehydratase domain-containing protein [Agromyces cerinus]